MNKFDEWLENKLNKDKKLAIKFIMINSEEPWKKTCEEYLEILEKAEVELCRQIEVGKLKATD